MRDIFATYHPIVNFMYFCAVIAFAMFFMNPLFLVISAAGAFAYSVYLNGKRALRFNLCALLPLIILVSLMNPLFNHSGVTILWYFLDNPITLESIVYGVMAGLMLASVIMWFSCYNSVMTSDKFMYLFGSVIPAISLIFSMVLRFVPRFKAQIKVISNAQKCIGRDAGTGGAGEKVRHGLKIMSVMTTWALENAVDTADSMKSRGYGLPGRTAFSNFRFDARDKLIFGVVLLLGVLIIYGGISGQSRFQYFPVIKMGEINAIALLIYGANLFLSFLPVILNMKENRKWRYLESKI